PKPHPAKKVDMAQTRARNIAKLTQRIENNKRLYRNAEITEADYRTEVNELRAELAYWEAYTTQREVIALQLTQCVQMLRRIDYYWDIAPPTERRILAHNLFDYF
ncbi:MAG: hypothetical protein HC915_09255, partial [Anaerolineae bacterium]|nr:hypothetical protein [Anaerolineae bacterium]